MTRFNSIVITGASSGIGAALALDYAAPGVTLALLGRDSERLAAVVAACQKRGAIVSARQIDVTDRQAVTAWLTEFDDASPIDLVIANAGISPDVENAHLSDLTLAHETMAVNVGGMFNTILPLLPRLVARGRGQIAIMASLAGFVGLPYAATYNASKAAVRVWGESLQYSLGPYGVGVTVVCPGFVTSRITERWPYVMPFLMPAERASSLIRRGIAQNYARIAFPLPLKIAIWAVGLLPAGIASSLIRLTARQRRSIAH
ncbi:Short-chain dehydrogenase [Enhydrobacter aerosaccus]|uniref:Short-chain dehydrogenase n=1 Tax=Enhydrobacter aerosaccus TaxID=225324 RepID=A0A1T4SCI8_9HYPH|nr:SDR family NAD(P)-dependent oxidoreductase [Enhydrobacter aerosaccus]SKA25895.1 Short-chain dehydrogenase [Enhydrobacter aerosaccus]